ncbi:hypothetical protein BURMUCF2_B0571 [Burkholderia multivorans CF2]|nr:hypothetical protein BURMUCF2_B0571 [Burkholderia multivorans CF2]
MRAFAGVRMPCDPPQRATAPRFTASAGHPHFCDGISQHAERVDFDLRTAATRSHRHGRSGAA